MEENKKKNAFTEKKMVLYLGEDLFNSIEEISFSILKIRSRNECIRYLIEKGIEKVREENKQ